MKVYGRLCLVLLDKIEPKLKRGDINFRNTLETLGVAEDAFYLADLFREIEGEFGVMIADKERRRLYRTPLSSFAWHIEHKAPKMGKDKERVEG